MRCLVCFGVTFSTVCIFRVLIRLAHRFRKLGLSYSQTQPSSPGVAISYPLPPPFPRVGISFWLRHFWPLFTFSFFLQKTFVSFCMTSLLSFSIFVLWGVSLISIVQYPYHCSVPFCASCPFSLLTLYLKRFTFYLTLVPNVY